jgi:hypothetical protein
MSVASDAVSEIRDFVERFSADTLLSRPKPTAKFTTAYKQLHALLIWSLLIQKGEFPDASYGVHPEEAISDASQAFALLSFSLYKPARVMARSAIENAVRVVVANAGADYGVKSVYVLFSHANDALTAEPIAKSIIAKLKTYYGKLCLTVHSAHEDHVALRIPFEKVFAFDEDQHELTLDLLSKTAAGINQLLYASFHAKLAKIEHKNRDYVLDSLPRALKRDVQA